MYCDKCGAHNPDNSQSCGACGASLVSPYQSPVAASFVDTGKPIFNWLVPAILATVFCCMPVGIVAVVYAAQVNAWIAGGNYAAGTKAAQNARMWFFIALGVGFVFYILYIGLMMIAALSDSRSMR